MSFFSPFCTGAKACKVKLSRLKEKRKKKKNKYTLTENRKGDYDERHSILFSEP